MPSRFCEIIAALKRRDGKFRQAKQAALSIKSAKEKDTVHGSQSKIVGEH